MAVVAIVPDLKTCEAIIEVGLSSFVEVGKALAKIRNQKLYQAQYHTFEEYCAERWGMQKTYTYQVISSAEVVNNLSAIADEMPLPRIESHARPLTRLKNPTDQAAVWRHLIESYDPETLTASLIEDEVKRYYEKKREAEGPKHQVRMEKNIPDWDTLQWDDPAPLFRENDVEGIQTALSLISSNRWIYELGFRRSHLDGSGGRLYDPDFAAAYRRLGGDWGVRMIGLLIKANIGWTEFGPGMIRAIVQSDFFSILETGINTAYQIDDVKEAVGITGRDAFVGYFGLTSKSVLQLEVDILRIFYQLRALEDRHYR